jgi:hypothetical protein
MSIEDEYFKVVEDTRRNCIAELISKDTIRSS